MFFHHKIVLRKTPLKKIAKKTLTWSLGFMDIELYGTPLWVKGSEEWAMSSGSTDSEFG